MVNVSVPVASAKPGTGGSKSRGGSTKVSRVPSTVIANNNNQVTILYHHLSYLHQLSKEVQFTELPDL